VKLVVVAVTVVDVIVVVVVQGENLMLSMAISPLKPLPTEASNFTI